MNKNEHEHNELKSGIGAKAASHYEILQVKIKKKTVKLTLQNE